MADLSFRMRTLLGAMRLDGASWQTPVEVARRLGWSVEETTDILADLDLAGLIAVRESEDSDPVVALVPLADDRPARSRENAPARETAAAY